MHTFISTKVIKYSDLLVNNSAFVHKKVKKV